MTLVELQYLVALAQELHFGRAAALCRVSQPALSMAISKLEKDWGVMLFERNKSGIQITSIGEQIIAHARRVVNQASNIKALAEMGKDQLSGTLVVGIIPTLAPFLLPSLIPQLRISAAKLGLCVHEDCGDTLRQKLRAGLLDVILVSQPFNGLDVLTQDLFEEPLVVLMSGKHPLAANKTICFADLCGQDFLLLRDGHCLRDQVLNLFSACADSQRPTFVDVSSMETLRNMVAAGLGISVIPLSVANSALYPVNLLTARSFVAPAPTRTIALAWRASFPRHKVIDVLRGAVVACTWQFTTIHETASQGLLVSNDNW